MSNDDLLNPEGLEIWYRVNEVLCKRYADQEADDWPAEVLHDAVGLGELILFHYGPMWTPEQEAEYLAEYQ